MDDKKPTLTRKFLLVTGLSLTIMVVTILIFNTYAMRRFMSLYVVETALPAQVEKIGNQVELILQPSILVSRVMAQNIWLIKYLELGEPSTNIVDIIDYLKAMKNGNNALNAYVISGNSLNYYTQDGIIKQISPSNERDQWYYRFVSSGKDYELVLDRDQTTDALTIYLNYAIKSAGKTIAVTGVSRSADDIREIVRKLKLGEYGYVFITSHDGKIQTHPNKEFLGQTMSSDPNISSEILDQLLSKNSTTVTHSAGFYVASFPLAHSDWRVIAVQPEGELFKGITQTIWFTIIIAGLIAIFSLLVVVSISGRLLRPIQDAALALHEIGHGEGDLRQRLPVSGINETDMLANGFNNFAQSLQGTIQRVDQHANHVTEIAQTLLIESGNTLNDAASQQVKTELVATAVTQMGATVNDIARSASEAAIAAQRAIEEANFGKTIVLETASSIDVLAREMSASTQSISELADDVAAIGQVLEVIRGISEQTNLLALNAAIEAARAGDQGRGFAVVADEVRNLAQRTQESTEEIRKTIERLQSNAQRSVTAMGSGQKVVGQSVERARKAEQSLTEINIAIDKISAMNYQIAAATEEQSTVTEDINKNIMQIANVAITTRDSANRGKEQCVALNIQAEDLKKLMATFKI